MSFPHLRSSFKAIINQWSLPAILKLTNSQILKIKFEGNLVFCTILSSVQASKAEFVTQFDVEKESSETRKGRPFSFKKGSLTCICHLSLK